MVIYSYFLILLYILTIGIDLGKDKNPLITILSFGMFAPFIAKTLGLF